MTGEEHDAASEAMRQAPASAVVALDAIVTTPTGKVAFVARCSDGRHLAMMAPQGMTLHADMIAMAQRAFDAQWTGPVPQ